VKGEPTAFCGIGEAARVHPAPRVGERRRLRTRRGVRPRARLPDPVRGALVHPTRHRRPTIETVTF